MQHEHALEWKGRYTTDPVACRALRLLASFRDTPRCLYADEAMPDENIQRAAGHSTTWRERTPPDAEGGEASPQPAE